MHRIAHMHSSIGHTAKVYHDTEWQEYRVKFYGTNGEYFSHADYHTDNKEDALETARVQLTVYKDQDE